MPSILHKNPLFCYYREPEKIIFAANRSCRGAPLAPVFICTPILFTICRGGLGPPA